MAGNGFGSGLEGISQTTITVVLVFLAISLYNVIELNFIIFGTFKRHSGLYFWSFLVSTWGIAVYCCGFFIKYYASSALGYLASTFISVGWVAMVSGQSLVLWSRLHLVLRNRFRLKAVLYMIIVNGVLMHGTVIPMIYGSFSPNTDMWKQPYSIMEKIQVTVFFIQEIIISCFYIYETVKMMRLECTMGNKRGSRRLMNHLVYVNILIILLDITILGLEYANQYQYQTSYKAFVYSTKLKLEFTILNRLVEMTTGNKDASSGPRSHTAGTTTGNKTNIALDTFISNNVDKPPGDISYRAYVMGGDERQTPRQTPRDDEVVMTTEVIVQREERGEDDGMSMGGKSSAESTIGTSKGHHYESEGLSKSSSEIHLASRGF
ncbi:uncharacterized protein FFB20_14269 [Fusarium fujikuroi]|uniref:DUF7703 domain-containing protein n=2 Tax=Fusarium fujikuroi TaxID=5127 RepID=S0DMQ3_GIBF5|nr:uncharacterized protein FFUJ_05125 [Fusarium fujikuroi IMI 58289]KLP03644.1 uncharacterized protein Y057_2800 [Fusarium fujikuroi]KLP06003.1 uncharacterized protein LW94_11844 [Fusarium fujikuroi]QGI59997.1 hypothetical protein CEK27_003968 [Fusarium fujikuroi]QGI77198.1 hypothetical protein CEK25_003927 [Fusarium fujikuroi]QGI90907.1 hypothetical protein CEK26_003976 [Fusarium fujikuroi]